jgi:glycosyltransferase involved in cell wall biosynthesis
MSKALKIATITANYNNGKYFTECLDGILSQTLKPNLAVIVDDGSTDDSVDTIIKAVKQRGGEWKQYNNDNICTSKVLDVTIVFIAQKTNRGPASARNAAIQVALDNKIDAVCIADSDDVLYPTKIQKSVDKLLKFPHVGLVYSDYDIYNQATGEIKREFKELYNGRRLFDECIVSNNSVIATSILNVVGPYDETLFGPEDYDMWLRISDVAAVYHIPEALYKYRITGNNITITTPSQRFAEHVHRVKVKAMERRNGK